MGKLDAVPPVMARGAPVTIYGDGHTPCAPSPSSVFAPLSSCTCSRAMYLPGPVWRLEGTCSSF